MGGVDGAVLGKKRVEPARLPVAVYPPTEGVEVLGTGLFGYVPKRAGIDTVVLWNRDGTLLTCLRVLVFQNDVASSLSCSLEVAYVD